MRINNLKLQHSTAVSRMESTTSSYTRNGKVSEIFSLFFPSFKKKRVNNYLASAAPASTAEIRKGEFANTSLKVHKQNSQKINVN